MASSITRKRATFGGKAHVRARSRGRFSSDGTFSDWKKTFPDGGESDYYSLDGTQVTVSENHPWPPPSGGFQGDIGGDFLSTNQIGSHSEGRRILYKKFGTQGPYDYKEFESGGLSVPIRTLSNGKPLWPTFLQSTDVELVAKGATAVARSKPTNASSNLLVALGEILHDGLPSLIGSQTWQSKTLAARNAGDEYLNKEFGWDPLISDITSFASSVRNANTIVSQYERDIGNLVRRRWNFPSESTRTETILAGNTFPLGLFFSLPGPEPRVTSGLWSVIEYTSKRQWFSGAFSYGVPLNSTGRGGMSDVAEKADKLFGISLTPDVLWQLTPWSWAVDWFTNTGDVLSNLSDYVSQGLVMHYGYIMEQTLHSYTYTLEGCTFEGAPLKIPPVTLTSTTKRRLRANPFGFGVSWDSLSPFQLSIAAALGISRL